MNKEFIESQSDTVQGKWNEVCRKYGKEWNIKSQGGGNGNWILTKKSDVLVDGKSYRSFVLKHYGKSRLTENLANRFFKDLEDGKINLDEI